MSILLLTVTALITLHPVTTYAYVTPEEVLFQNDFFFPPTNRNADERARAREEERLENLSQRQQKDLAERNPTKSPSLEEVLASLADAIESIDNRTASPDEKRDVRVLDRIERRQASVPQTLNSGAPLAPTGTGTFIATGTIVAAALWTLRRARRMQGE
ncbi:hypothetical protein HYZ98_04090 [Candidatus Peregrinibacteria bacterium]|nr:hypothetical protein [Candidatus Peregrinibacteria bacterium]